MRADERTKDESLIYQLLTRQAQAIRDRDADLALSVYTQDATCYDLDPPLVHGPGEVLSKARIQAWFDTWRGPIEQETRDLRIHVGADLAFAYALQRMSGEKVGGQAVDLWYRATTCLRRARGAWRIAHAHYSVPFYMDGSDRAALDLDPSTAGHPV
jgi:ketosteroid isomerase-like protein